MKKKGSKIQDRFDFFLKHFEQDPKPEVIWTDFKEGIKTVQEFQIELPSKLRIYNPYIVFIIFVYLKNYVFQGIGEKVAWTIPIKYKGAPFILTHRKFGFSIISNSNSDKIIETAIEAISNIKKAIPYAETLFEPYVIEQINKGNITLENNYRIILNRYRFFRRKAKTEFAKSKKAKIKVRKNPKTNSVSFQITSFKYISSAEYYVTAMLDSYFCLIEHIFVLLLPFLSHIAIEEINLENFIGENWKQKFKVVLPLNNNKIALQLFERLNKIKEEFRNPMTHGYFLKNGNSFYIHNQHLGAIPMTLKSNHNKMFYSTFPSPDINFEEICICFDDFENFIKKEKTTKFGLQYILNGLSIAFDKFSSLEYKSHMSSLKNFKKFILYQLMQEDKSANMDW